MPQHLEFFYGKALSTTGCVFVAASVAFEFVDPALTFVFSFLPVWKRYTDLKNDLGRSMHKEITESAYVALFQTAAFGVTFYGVMFDSKKHLEFGLFSDLAVRFNDAALAFIGYQRHVEEPQHTRYALVAHHFCYIVLGVLGISNFICHSESINQDVRLICLASVVSNTVMAAIVPWQFAFGLTSRFGTRASLAMQATNLLVFTYCRFVVGVLPNPQNGAYMKVFHMLMDISPFAGAGFAVLALGGMFGYSGIIAYLLFQRMQLTRQADKRIKHIRMWFDKNKKKAPEEEIQKYVWENAKMGEMVVASPATMLAAKWKVAPKVVPMVGPMAPKAEAKTD